MIKDGRVSKSHFKIYTIIFDKSKEDIAPMLYCEDLESSNGTYVNGVLIGNENTVKLSGKMPYLLNDGDIIDIKPYWKFKVCQKSPAANSNVITRRNDQHVRFQIQMDKNEHADFRSASLMNIRSLIVFLVAGIMELCI